MASTQLRLFIFAVICVAGVYLFSCLVKRRSLKIEPVMALLYISSVAMIGMLGEIIVGNIYANAFGGPLWRYNFLPIHDAYTSQFSPILWGSFGFYLYLLHDTKKRWTHSQIIKLSIIFALQALLIEAVADLVSLVVLGELMYYYYPAHFWHVTAIQNIPFYFVTGLVITYAIHWFKASPRLFTFLCASVVLIVVFFTG